MHVVKWIVQCGLLILWFLNLILWNVNCILWTVSFILWTVNFLCHVNCILWTPIVNFILWTPIVNFILWTPIVNFILWTSIVNFILWNVDCLLWTQIINCEIEILYIVVNYDILAFACEEMLTWRPELSTTVTLTTNERCINCEYRYI